MVAGSGSLLRFGFWLALAVGLSGCVPLPSGLFSSQKVDIKDQVAAVDARDGAKALDTLPVHYGGLNLRMPVKGTPGRYRWTPLCHGPYSDITAADIYREIPADSTFWRDAFAIGISAGGLAVTAGPINPFARADQLGRAEYMIAAAVVGLEVSLCRKRGWLTGDRLGTTGETEIVVDWHIYSRLSRQVIKTIRSRGSARLRIPHEDALPALTMAAFENAAASLATKPALHAALERPHRQALAASVEGPSDPPPEADSATAIAPNRAQHTPLRIPPRPRFTGAFGERSEWISRALVSIAMGNGSYGSGFIISEDGHILTSQNAVGDAERVRVEFSRELWVEGTVLRRDRRHDVALIKLGTLPPGGVAALPLRRNAPPVGHTVYAIGAPSPEHPRDSVSRGIVSSYRRGRSTVQRILQADIAIYPGGSGGPLFDRSGNVVAIATSRFADPYTAGITNLNFFVPIDKALRHLNLRIGRTQLSESDAAGSPSD